MLVVIELQTIIMTEAPTRTTDPDRTQVAPRRTPPRPPTTVAMKYPEPQPQQNIPPIEEPQRIVVMHGDLTGEMLMREGLRVLKATNLPLEFTEFNLGNDEPEARKDRVMAAANALKIITLGYKAPVTDKLRKDGTVNELLREQVGASVIVRKIDGDKDRGPVTIVSMASTKTEEGKIYEDTYDHYNYAPVTKTISDNQCRLVAGYACKLASQEKGKIIGGPSNNLGPQIAGMFARHIYEASERYPDVPYEPSTLDTAIKRIIKGTKDHLILPALEGDGNTVSNLVVDLYAKRGIIPSLTLRLGEASFVPNLVIAESIHGTVRRLEGKNEANPTAMILAGASLLDQIGRSAIPIKLSLHDARAAATAIRSAVAATIQGGKKTSDLGGTAKTTDFTDAVIERMTK